MIIHINGLPGSGKSTLGNKIKQTFKNVIVVDTDDIDDPNSVKIFNKYTFETKSDYNKYHKELAKLNKQDIKKILDDNKNKIMIFVGGLHSGIDFLEKKVDLAYAIKIDPETLYKQYNLRTLECIHKNYTEIKKLLNSETHPKKIHSIFSKKFGIRTGFDSKKIDDLKNNIKKAKDYSKENNIFYGTSDAILKDINNKIKN